MGNTHQVSPGNSVQRMACSTHLSVHLETSSDRGMVKCGEHAVQGPVESRRVETVLSGGHGAGSHGILVKNVRSTNSCSGNSQDGDLAGGDSRC